jgi:hypothetical protein
MIYRWKSITFGAALAAMLSAGADGMPVLDDFEWWSENQARMDQRFREWMPGS